MSISEDKIVYFIIIYRKDRKVFYEWFNKIWKSKICKVLRSYQLNNFLYFQFSVNHHVILQIQSSCLEDLQIFCEIQQDFFY